jgi:hypothetical protein
MKNGQGGVGVGREGGARGGGGGVVVVVVVVVDAAAWYGVMGMLDCKCT